MSVRADQDRSRSDLIRELHALRAEHADALARIAAGSIAGDPGTARSIESVEVPDDRGVAEPPDAAERDRARWDAERLARSVLDSLSSPVATLDESGTIQAVNRAWREFAGAGEPAPVGSNYLAVCDATRGPDEDGAASFARGIRAVLAGREAAYDQEYPCHTPGRRRWFLGSVRPFQGEGPPRVVVVHQEVTARVLAEEANRRSEALFGQAFLHAPIGLALASVEPLGALARVNPAFCSMVGYTEDELVAGHSCYTVSEPEMMEREGALTRSLIAGEIPFYCLEKPYRHQSGRTIWGRLHVTILRGEPGAPSFLLGMVEEITERRAAEQALRRSAERLEALHEIDQAILAARSPGAIAEAALQRLVRLIPGRRGWITLDDPAGGEPRLLASVGPADEPGPGELPPFLVPLTDRLGPIGLLRLDSDPPPDRSPEAPEIIREVADLVAVALRQSLLFEAIAAARANLESLSRRLIRAEEGERRRIAHELHDETGQTLTAIKINLRAAIRSPDDPSNPRRLAECLGLVERTLGQVRNLSLDLRPSLLDDFGLVPALRAHAEASGRRLGIEVRFRADPAIDRCDPEVETACYRVAQEALNNAAKHAGATRIRVELTRVGDEFELLVADDGQGFDVASATARSATGLSLGMVGMRERAALIGGRVAIDSAPGRGAEVRAAFPTRPVPARPTPPAIPG